MISEGTDASNVALNWNHGFPILNFFALLDVAAGQGDTASNSNKLHAGSDLFDVPMM